jgi:large subunit ribosomal protein L19
MQAKKYTKETIVNYRAEDRGFPDFNVGDSISVIQRIQEGDKERLQTFQGDVIAFRNNGVSSMFTVRKLGAHGVAVERIFPYYSPLIKTIEVNRRGAVRRAKLYYMRGRVGKAAKIKELIVSTHKVTAVEPKQ